MNANPENNWSYVDADAEDPFADKPFQAALEENTPLEQVPKKAEENHAEGSEEMADAEEARKRAAHEAEEARRKAEFDARQEAKRKAVQERIDRVGAMTNEEAMNAAIRRTGADTEKLVRKNMKEMVTEFIQTLCIEDSAFARLALHPRKSMIRCFQYINRKAFEYVQDEMKANGITPGPGMQTYGADIPEDVCYQWAEEYFRDPTVKEDEEQEEQFVPKPYPGKTAAQPRKKTEKKKAEKKATVKAEPPKPKDEAQLTFGQMAMV